MSVECDYLLEGARASTDGRVYTYWAAGYEYPKKGRVCDILFSILIRYDYFLLFFLWYFSFFLIVTRGRTVGSDNRSGGIYNGRTKSRCTYRRLHAPRQGGDVFN